MIRTHPITEARRLFLGLIDRLQKTFERVVITKHGRPVAVLLSYDDYVRLTASLELLQQKKDARGGSQTDA